MNLHDLLSVFHRLSSHGIDEGLLTAEVRTEPIDEILDVRRGSGAVLEGLLDGERGLEAIVECAELFTTHDAFPHVADGINRRFAVDGTIINAGESVLV